MKKSAAEADLQTLQVDQLLAHVYITGSTDINLRRKFLELHNPQLNEMDHIAQAYESTQKSMRTTDDSYIIRALRQQIEKEQRLPRSIVLDGRLDFKLNLV